jgi:16S rRNA (guanine1207-N2)-methyltransferase
VRPFSFDALRRHPDVEAANLFAADAADRLILDEAADALAASAPGEVAIIGDNYGALTLGAAALHGAAGIRVHQDALTGERALAENADRFGLPDAYGSFELDAALLAGARVVLLRLPKSLSALDEIAEAIGRFASDDVTVYAGGMLKHMTRSMNDVLAAHFDSVRAGLARQKARVLTAFLPGSRARWSLEDREAIRDPSAERAGERGTRGTSAAYRDLVSRSQDPSPGLDTLAGARYSTTETWPRRAFHDDLDLWVCAHGGAFAGTDIDIGTRFLLGFLEQAKPDAATAIDLGCGTGVLASVLAKRRPGIRVLAADQSAAAVASARATAAANGVADRVTVVRDDALSTRPDASAELILLNPPFHLGSSVHAGAGLKLIEDAGRVLAPGGELWTVFNSHLAYQSALRRVVGPTRQVGRNAKFTVTVSTKSEGAAPRE